MNIPYSGLIQIELSKVSNPSTNENLARYILFTYDDAELAYPID